MARRRPPGNSGQSLLLAGGLVAFVAAWFVIGSTRSVQTLHKRRIPLLGKPLDAGVEVLQDCLDVKIVDELKYQEALAETIQFKVNASEFDPLEIAAHFVYRTSLGCAMYPKDTDSPAKTRFMFIVGVDVIDALMEDGILSQEQGRGYFYSLVSWVLRNGLEPAATQQLIDQAPASMRLP
jgi:hypothetical protein